MPASIAFSLKQDNLIRSDYLTMRGEPLAHIVGCTLKQLRKRAAKLGIKHKFRRWDSTDDEVIRSAWECRELRDVARQLRRKESDLSQYSRKLLGYSGRWKSKPKRVSSRGYGIHGLRKKGGKVATHFIYQHVMEEHLGRHLRKGECVHHINADKEDDRLDNLHLFPSPAAHRRAHMSVERMLPVLLERGIVHFDRSTGVYVLCETSK